MAIPTGLENRIKSYIDADNPSVDPGSMRDLILGVLGIFETEIAQKLSAPSESVSRIVPVIGGQTSFLFSKLVQVSALEWAFYPVPDAWTSLDGWTQQGAVVYKNTPVSAGFLRVTMTRGFDDEEDMPEDIKQALAEVVGVLYRTKRGVRSTFAQDDREILSSIPPHVWRTLRGNRTSAVV